MLPMPLKLVLGAEVQASAVQLDQTRLAYIAKDKAQLWLRNPLDIALNAAAQAESQPTVVNRALVVAGLGGGFAGFHHLVTNLRKASIRLSLEQFDRDLSCRKLAFKGLIRLAQNH